MPATRPDNIERQPTLFEDCGMDIDFSQWGPGFDAYMAEFAGRFPRVEPRGRATSYVRGLLSELERKNGWTLAEAAGDKTTEGMQRLLNASPWDEGGVRDDLREIVTNAIGDKERRILVVDETGCLKKGKKSAGAARMYTGVKGHRFLPTGGHETCPLVAMNRPGRRYILVRGSIDDPTDLAHYFFFFNTGRTPAR